MCMSVYVYADVWLVYSPMNRKNNPQHHQRVLNLRALAMTAAHTASLPACLIPPGDSRGRGEKAREIEKWGKMTGEEKGKEPRGGKLDRVRKVAKKKKIGRLVVEGKRYCEPQ